MTDEELKEALELARYALTSNHCSSMAKNLAAALLHLYSENEENEQALDEVHMFMAESGQSELFTSYLKNQRSHISVTPLNGEQDDK